MFRTACRDSVPKDRSDQALNTQRYGLWAFSSPSILLINVVGVSKKDNFVIIFTSLAMDQAILTSLLFHQMKSRF